MRPSAILFAALVSVLPATGADAPALKLYVLDAEALTVSAVDPANGGVVGKAGLEGEPFLLLPSPAGSRLVVLDRGPGKDAGAAGYKAKAKSSATVIDTDTFGVVASVSLGWGLRLSLPPIWSADGRRLTVYCPGLDSKKSSEALPRELVVLDVVGGKEAARLALPRAVDAWAVAPDGKRLFALSQRIEMKKADAIPAELLIIDAGEPAVEATIPLEGAPDQMAVAGDGRHVYLLDPGTPSRKPEKNINGRIHVVGTASRKVEASVDAGSRPAGFLRDDERGRILVLSDGAPAKDVDNPEGELRVFSGAEMAGPTAVIPWPLFVRVSPDAQRLYVVGPNSISKVGIADLKPISTIPFEGAGINWMSSEGPGPVKELGFTPDSKRGFLLYENSSKLLVLDLEAGTTVGSVTTGRGGKKFLKMLGAAAMTAGSYYAGQQQARNSGGGYFTYSVYGAGVASTGLAIRSDGKFAYVLNTQTNDVTIVDTQAAQSLEKIGAGGNELRLLPGGALVVVSESSIHVLDTESNTKRETVEIDDVRVVERSPDGRHLAVLGKKQALILDGQKATTVSRAEGFKGAADMVFELTPTPPPTPEPTPTPTATPTARPKRAPVKKKAPPKTS